MRNLPSRHNLNHQYLFPPVAGASGISAEHPHVIPHYRLSAVRLHQNDPEVLRSQIRNDFIQTFDTYESLFDCLRHDEAYYIKPIALRHPLIFYFGHTATFFINKMLLGQLISQRIDPHFESIFAVGVDEMSWDDLNDTHYDWPSVQDVKAYRMQVRTAVLDFIDHAPLTLPLNWQHAWWVILMGIEHERIHLETSSVLIRQHQLHHVRPQTSWQPSFHSGAAPENQLLHVAAGTVKSGKSLQDDFYGWDNEYGVHSADIEAFEASKYLVSNHEFLAFFEAGGYQQNRYWEEEGQRWLGFSQAKHPAFWHARNDGWTLRLMTEEVPMRWDWPAEVNYHEAKAFCNWKAEQTGQPVRLPTEDEWYRLYDAAGLDSRLPAPEHANLLLRHGASSCPVNQFQQGDFFDVQGNVWQWTETPIYPYEGFDVHPLYDDFSTPTFDGQHHLIKGGSWISCGNEALHASRYAFRKHFFQHAGFRYVVSDQAPLQLKSHYETDMLASQYLEFQYGASYFNVPNFAQALVRLAMQKLTPLPKGKALDLGCATGRAAFELAQYFDQVTGLDFSARFIQHGVQLASGETLRYAVPVEGELAEYKSCSLGKIGLEHVRQKVEFFQADACNLKPIFSGYDFILAANLIDRLHCPAQFISTIHQRLNAGGVLMLASPYTWLEEHTPRSAWVGGFKRDGENFTTLDGLKALLSVHFDLMSEPEDVPFVIRETARKYQHTLSQVSFWQRKR